MDDVFSAMLQYLTQFIAHPRVAPKAKYPNDEHFPLSCQFRDAFLSLPSITSLLAFCHHENSLLPRPPLPPSPPSTILSPRFHPPLGHQSSLFFSSRICPSYPLHHLRPPLRPRTAPPASAFLLLRQRCRRSRITISGAASHILHARAVPTVEI